MHTHPDQWAVNGAAPGEQLGVRCLAQGFHLSRGQFLPEPRFEPTTSCYKSDALSIRPRLPIHVYKTSCDARVKYIHLRHIYLKWLKCPFLRIFSFNIMRCILECFYTALKWHLKIVFIHLPNPFILFKLQINQDLINLISWENYCTKWRFLNLHNSINTKHFLWGKKWRSTLKSNNQFGVSNLYKNLQMR